QVVYDSTSIPSFLPASSVVIQFQTIHLSIQFFLLIVRKEHLREGSKNSNQAAKLAHSRPPPVRTTHSATAAASPPLSPKRSHHHRRKSGKEHVATEKKASRPTSLSRRTTPQYVTKVGPGWSGGRGSTSARDGEEGGRDSGESFPQFCWCG
ncbi:hypothetical protein LHYA1_G008536, partial [Lachnellula hyalina]